MDTPDATVLDTPSQSSQPRAVGTFAALETLKTKEVLPQILPTPVIVNRGVGAEIKTPENKKVADALKTVEALNEKGVILVWDENGNLKSMKARADMLPEEIKIYDDAAKAAKKLADEERGARLQLEKEVQEKEQRLKAFQKEIDDTRLALLKKNGEFDEVNRLLEEIKNNPSVAQAGAVGEVTQTSTIEEARLETAKIATEQAEAEKIAAEEKEKEAERRLETLRRDFEDTKAALLRSNEELKKILEEMKNNSSTEAQRREAEVEQKRIEDEQTAMIEAQKKEEARIEAERVAADQAEKERVEREEAERREAEIKAEKEAVEKAEAERIAAETEAARITAETEAQRAEELRLANEKAEADRLEAEKTERERVEKEQAAMIEAQKKEEERIEAERVEALQVEKERVEREEAERIEAQKTEEAKLANEKAEETPVPITEPTINVEAPQEVKEVPVSTENITEQSLSSEIKTIKRKVIRPNTSLPTSLPSNTDNSFVPGITLTEKDTTNVQNYWNKVAPTTAANVETSPIIANELIEPTQQESVKTEPVVTETIPETAIPLETEINNESSNTTEPIKEKAPVIVTPEKKTAGVNVVLNIIGAGKEGVGSNEMDLLSPLARFGKTSKGGEVVIKTLEERPWLDSLTPQNRQLATDILSIDPKELLTRNLNIDTDSFINGVINSTIADILTKETEKGLFGGPKGITVLNEKDFRLNISEFIHKLESLRTFAEKTKAEISKKPFEDVPVPGETKIEDYIKLVKEKLAELNK